MKNSKLSQIDEKDFSRHNLTLTVMNLELMT